MTSDLRNLIDQIKLSLEHNRNEDFDKYADVAYGKASSENKSMQDILGPNLKLGDRVELTDRYTDSGKHHFPHNNEYIIRYVGQMKSPNTGDWCECVIYTEVESGKIYCRELNSFITKFRKVDAKN